jgi:hypothetical protein
MIQSLPLVRQEVGTGPFNETSACGPVAFGIRGLKKSKICEMALNEEVRCITKTLCIL